LPLAISFYFFDSFTLSPMLADWFSPTFSMPPLLALSAFADIAITPHSPSSLFLQAEAIISFHLRAPLTLSIIIFSFHFRHFDTISSLSPLSLSFRRHYFFFDFALLISFRQLSSHFRQLPGRRHIAEPFLRHWYDLSFRCHMLKVAAFRYAFQLSFRRFFATITPLYASPLSRWCQPYYFADFLHILLLSHW